MLLGEILTDEYDISPKDVEKALNFQAQYGGRIGSILLNMGAVSEETLVAALSRQLGIRTFSDIDRKALDFSGLEGVDALNVSFLADRRWLPLKKESERWLFASLDPLDYEVIQYLENEAVAWEACILTESQFRELEGEFQLSRTSEKAGDLDVSDILDAEVDKLRELASEAPIVNLVNSHIARAVGRRASDLHFEPYKNMYRVRIRIDGLLHDVDFLPLNMQIPVASRIKILAGLDIAERRRPQDGQMSMKVSGKEIDIRVSALPLAHGESLVLRFLVKESIGYELDHLGLEKDLVALLSDDIRKTAGVILLTGPTGSGKTTTLYSCLNRINSEDKKIITIEDPVEYQLDGINQIQVQSDIGYDFLAALRSILRQDPDILMVGEIRDGETARVAMQSSLTGHLVFSTVHTNDAPTAFVRLIDLGLDEYLINSALIAVIAQRLVRRICPECAVPLENDGALIKAHQLDTLAAHHHLTDIRLLQPVGCPACNQTGYRGRISIMEYLRCTPDIRAMEKDQAFSHAAKRYMAEHGIRTLAEDGLLKAVKGMTSIEEVFRVCG